MYPTTYQNKEDGSAVYWFSSPFDPLNNWSAHTINIYDRVFYTLEHAYHYRKFIDSHAEIAEEIAHAPSPWAAKQIAKRETDKVRADWNDIKVGIMEDLVRAKHSQNIDVQQVLEKTGKRLIVENSPLDSFWGIGKDGDGQNIMGKIWVKVRDGE